MHLLLTLIDPFDLFTESTGEWLYFFLIIAISLANLFMILGQRLRHSDNSVIRRYTWAFLGIVFSWIALMGGAVAALAFNWDANQVLPPLERFSSIVTIFFTLWVFWDGGKEQSRQLPNMLLGVGVIVLIAGYISSAIWWADLAGTTDFNLSDLGVTWDFVAAIVCAVGIGLILNDFKVIADAPLKLVFFAILLLGFGVTLVQIGQGKIVGDYSGATRLAFVSALGVGAVVVYRTIIASLELEIYQHRTIMPQTKVPQPMQQASDEQKTANLDGILEMMLTGLTNDNRPERIVSSVIRGFKVDVCALLVPKGPNYVEIIAGYNHSLKRDVQNISINLGSQPTLSTCLDRRNQTVLTVDQNLAEIKDLLAHLEILEHGTVYLQPLIFNNRLVAVLMIAMPYTKGTFGIKEERLLEKLGDLAGGILILDQTFATEVQDIPQDAAIDNIITSSSDAAESKQNLQQSLRLAREQIAQLTAHIIGLKTRLKDESSRVANELSDSQMGLAISQQMVSLTNEHVQVREERDALLNQVQEAETVLQGALATSDEALLEEMIESLQHEKATLTIERDRLQAQLDSLPAEDNRTPESLQKMIDRMTEEKTHLVEERDQLATRLEAVQSQLENAGIEMGSAGLVHFIQQLVEQRITLQEQNTALRSEYARLLDERIGLAGQIKAEKDKEAQVRLLEQELENLATAREVAVKQRDQTQVDFNELQNKLDLIKEHRTRLLAQTSTYEEEQREAHLVQTRLRGELRKLINERSELMSDNDRLIAEKRAVEIDRDQLLARVEGNRERLQDVGTSGIGSLTSMVEELTEQRMQLEYQLNEKNSSLETSELSNKILREQLQEEKSIKQQYPGNLELLVSLVQELRTPMTSIVGYVDLLLGESAGILGEMQRKFLQRVSTNISRLAIMLNDLIRITELDTGKITFEPVSVNITNVIEDAITNASNQFREKELTINLSIEANLPTVNVDRDAIEQVVGQLLNNAYLVSPPNTEISVKADLREMALQGNDDEINCLYIAVADYGGGINERDEARVFARKYKAENPLIPGLGDTGVGMAIAKALVEAQGGRLWVDVEENVGSSFAFALPLVAVSGIGE